jgi:hypothetical protein
MAMFGMFWSTITRASTIDLFSKSRIAPYLGGSFEVKQFKGLAMVNAIVG